MNSSNQVEIIKQYLIIDTNYAVIITGKYGIGKTFFYKNELSPMMEKTSIPGKPSKKYIPIHISLFGIKSIEDVQSQIFLSLFPILKNKKVKLASGIGKMILRGTTQLLNLGEVDKYFEDFESIQQDYIDYDELVLCFDDLDRVGDGFKINDILGFTNSLVENAGAKVILIANDKILHETEGFNKNALEKVIGIFIQYSNNIEAVCEAIIKDKCSESKAYCDFLMSHKSLIIETIQKNDGNLRNLLFFIEHFRVIHNSLIGEFAKEESFNAYKDEVLNIVLSFTLAISIEYKTGRLNPLTYDMVIELDKYNSFGLSKLISNKAEGAIEKNYTDEFYKKYYSNSVYRYLDSVFKHITGQSPFEISKLKKELNKWFPNEDGNVPEELKVLNSLSYIICLDLSDREYKRLTYKMIRYAEQGKYSINEYPTVFHFATRFNNLLDLDFENLKSRLKKGIDRGKANNNYDHTPMLRLYVDEESEFRKDIEEIVHYCVKVNETIKKENRKQKNKEINILLKTDLNGFIRANKDNKYLPFLMDFSIHDTYLAINSLTNSQITDFAFYLGNRYTTPPQSLKEETNFLITLKERINKPKKRNIKNLRNTALDLLIQKIDLGINNLSSLVNENNF